MAKNKAIAKTTAKRSRGRPTKFKREYCEMLITHMSAGFSFESFAGVINVNQDTLHEWAKKHKNFSESKEMAFSKCRLFWENIGIQVCLGRSQINASIWIFNMKNRFGWRDKEREEDERVRQFEPIVIELPNAGKKIEIDNKNRR
jgi:hypothetical protein